MGFGGKPGDKADMEIVGVVKDAKYTSVRDEIPRQLFVAYSQSEYQGEMTAFVRTTMASNQMFNTVRSTIKQMDSNLPVYNMKTFETQLDESLSTERLISTLSSIFGMIATVLALVGLYGVMAYTVARRAREIGIRMALGAEPGNVVWMVMKEVIVLVSVGVAIGLPAAIALSQYVSSQLYEVKPTDMATLVAATILMTSVALFAGWMPARRAARVDPVQVLRYE